MESPRKQVPRLQPSFAARVAADLDAGEFSSEALRDNAALYRTRSPEFVRNLQLMVGADNPEKATEILGLLTVARANPDDTWAGRLSIALSPYAEGTGSSLGAGVSRDLMDVANEPIALSATGLE